MYRVVVVDKPITAPGASDWNPPNRWIWRIINRHGHIIAGCYGSYKTERDARKASKRILQNLKWGTR